MLATYAIEDITMDLTVTLTDHHPLGVLNVQCGKRMGVTAAQWRKWMLQLTTFLNHQVWLVYVVS